MSGCPVEGCGGEIPATLLMCREHWRLVPRPLQLAVTDAWRWRLSLQRPPRAATATPEDRRAAFEAHDRAKRNAIAAVNARLGAAS